MALTMGTMQQWRLHALYTIGSHARLDALSLRVLVPPADLCGELEPTRRRKPASSLDCPALGLPSASAVGSGAGVGEEGAAELKASAKAVKILPDGARVGGDKACSHSTTHAADR